MKIKVKKLKNLLFEQGEYSTTDVCDYKCEVKRFCGLASCNCKPGEYYIVYSDIEKIEFEEIDFE